MGLSGGGVFLPGDPPPSTGQQLTAPVITGAMTVTGGAASFYWQTAALTATGTTGSNAANVTIGPPGLITVTGAASSGINLPVPLGGEFYMIKNLAAATINIYCVGGTINGTTGTTAATLTNTGTKGEGFMSVVAGQWQTAPNAT